MLHWHVTFICLLNGILLSLVRDNQKMWIDDYNIGTKFTGDPVMGVHLEPKK